MYFTRVTLAFVVAFVVALSCSSAKECNRETLTQCLYEMESGMEMITSEHDYFKQLNSAYNSRKRFLPSGFLVANKQYDVQIGVKCLKKFRCPFTIKSGGNRFETESFGRSTFYALDLSNLTRIEMYKRTMRAVVQSGALISDVSSTLYFKHRFGVSGGVFPKASFGGHVLNGGWSTTARKYGLASQNVLEMTVVNSEGEVMTVSPVENKPLFFALRGAGQGNFGVVTDYSVRMFEVPHEVSVLRVTYNFTDFRDVFEKWQTYANKFDESVTSVMIIGKNTIDLYSTVINADRNHRIRLTNKVLTHFTLHGIKANIVNMNYNDMNDMFYNIFSQFKIRTSKSNFVDKILSADEIERLHLSLFKLFEKHPDALNINYEFGGKIESAFEDSAFIHTHHSYLFQVFVNDVVADESVVDINVGGTDASGFVPVGPNDGNGYVPGNTNQGGYGPGNTNQGSSYVPGTNQGSGYVPGEANQGNGYIPGTTNQGPGYVPGVVNDNTGFVPNDGSRTSNSGYVRNAPFDAPLNDPSLKIEVVESLKVEPVSTEENIGPINRPVNVEIIDKDKPETVRVMKTIKVLDAENNIVKEKTVVVDEVLAKVTEQFYDEEKISEEELRAAELLESIKASLKAFFEEISFMDSSHSYQYFGDYDADLTRYYGEYSSTLQRIKCIYDSENVFKHSTSIPLKCGQSHAYKLEL